MLLSSVHVEGVLYPEPGPLPPAAAGAAGGTPTGAGGTMSGLIRLLLRLARFLGDVSAASRGPQAYGRRMARRAWYRATRRLLRPPF